MAIPCSFETSIEVNEVETDVTVEYTFYSAYRGARDGRFGPPIEPDEPAHVEIDAVLDSSGKDISNKLTDTNFHKLEEEAMEHFGNDEPDYDND